MNPFHLWQTARVVIFSCVWAALTFPSRSAEPVLLGVTKIWDGAPHNAFTDLARFHDNWFCVFREGQGHVSPDGAVRVLRSANGTQWESAAVLRHNRADLRDPKLTVTPTGQLMLTAAGAWHPPAPAKHQTFAWFSTNGAAWGEPVAIGEPNLWLWRVIWHQGQAYGVGYDTLGEHFVRLYRSANGRDFSVLVTNLFSQGYPNETGVVFLPDDSAVCLLRRDGNPGSAQLGTARPPYTHWEWKDLGVKVGGPNLIRLPDGRLLACVRLYDGAVRTSLTWLDLAEGKLRECLRLPSGGDTSYAGMVWHAGEVWVSYYSSHEGKTSIYLARVKT